MKMIHDFIINDNIYHLREPLDERDIAELLPPERTDTDPLEDKASISLGALLGKSIPFSRRKSSISGPRSGKSSPKFLNNRRST